MTIAPTNAIVIGAGGHAKVVIATIRAAGGDVVQAYDDDGSRWGKSILGVPVVGPAAEAASVSGPAVLAIGSNRARALLAEQLSLDWLSVCHPTAVVHRSASIGAGAVVFAGSVIQPETRIGPHAIINTAASVDHDCIVGAFSHIGPGARVCGGVTIDEGVLLGVAAAVAPNVEVGAWSTLGAGAVCIVDVPASVTAVGVPARPIEADG